MIKRGSASSDEKGTIEEMKKYDVFEGYLAGIKILL